MRRNLTRLTLSTILGASIGITLANAQVGHVNLRSSLNGLMDGSLIAFALGFYHWFIYRGFAQGFFRRTPFALLLGIQFSIYLILIVAMRTIGRFLANDYTVIGDIWRDSYAAESVLVGAAAALVLNFLVYVTALLDLPTILAFLSGRYHRPRKEHRVFLFVDLVSSTGIAEQIGGEKFALLLDMFFSDMTEPLVRTGGAIYKYVGDEAIITWPQRKASADKCMQFHSHFKTEIQKNRPRYQSGFGLVPEFRAAAHAGEIIACEIGTLKKEIAFLGDTVNVAARLLEESRKTARSFVVSEAIAEQLAPKEKEMLQKLGRLQVRGRSELVEVYAVSEGAM